MKKSKDTTMKKKKNEEESSQSNNNNGGVEPRNVITDPRFSSVHTDPRFQNLPRQRSKVFIDKRFERMFDDKSFASSSAPSDKRGKLIPKPKTAKEKLDSNPLHKYYRTEDDRVQKPKIADRDSDDEEDSEEEAKVKVKDHVDLDKLGQEDSESNSDDEHEDSDEDDDDEDSDGDSIESTDDEEAFVENVAVTHEVTHRLAAVNMDWRQIKAEDLYEVLSTSLPKGGVINSVAVYPSEFGIKRMEEEAIRGPIALFGGDKGQNDEDDDEDSDDDIDEEKLRAYEQSKLSYYYAVVDCDSSDTTDHLYKSYDGVELERSSNMFDLRFIPDEMEFKHPPRDIATERPSNYKGLDFITRELQHSKVNLTWDEDEPHRAKTLKRKFTEDQLAELEFKEFLASDDSEAEENEDDGTKENEKTDRYRTLLLSGGGSDEDGEDEGQDMEVTFKSGLEDISKRILEKKDTKSESVWDAYLRKRRETKSSRKNKSKKSSDDESSDDDEEPIEQDDDFFIEDDTFKKSKETKSKRDKKEKQQMDKGDEASRAELELLLADDLGAKTTNVKGYNLKPKKVKGKKEKYVPQEEKLPTTDYDDPRFSALFTSHLYALDPTDPNFKRSKAYVQQLAQKQQKADSEERGHKKRKNETHLSSDDSEAKKQEKVKLEAINSNKEKCEISSMIKSIKMKSKQLPSDGTRSKKDDQPKGGKDEEKDDQQKQKKKKMTKKGGEGKMKKTGH